MHSKVASTGPVERRLTIRLIALILAALVISGPTTAQNWQEYSYPDYGFTVTFPADPKIETTIHEVADGRSVPARVYSVARTRASSR